MTLSVPEITRIAAEVAREHDGALLVLGVSSSDGGSGRAEILIRVRGCHAEPCTIQLNVPRNHHSELELELRTKLQEAFARHRP
jgi:hypothetical protein